MNSWTVGAACVVFGLMSGAACSVESDSGASDDDDSSAGNGGAGGSAVGSGSGGQGGEAEPQPFVLTSSAFVEGAVIPTVYECGPPIAEGPGNNTSPPLTWTPGPPGTQSYAIVMRDIDAGGLVHWVLYDIPASVVSLPEGIPSGYQPVDPAGSKQAELQGVVHSYFGPCSPSSINTYQLTVHALDVAAVPDVDMSTPENTLAAAVEGLSIASAQLSGES